MKKIIVLILFTTIVYANPLMLNNQTFHDLLPSSQIYIDHNKSLTIEEIRKKDSAFKANSEKLLGFGYSPDFHVWIKFTLHNDTDQPLHQIIEYDNPLATNILFFDADKKIQEGLFYIDENRTSINPIFKITLQPQERKTYYIKTSSHIVTLIVKLNLWHPDRFFAKEMKHQISLALFFGAMLILALYNLFIYFFTKDNSYLFYVLYILGISVHHLMYVGVTNVYLIDPAWIESIIGYASVIVGFPAFVLALFTKSFLHTKQYPRFNKILNIYLTLFPFLISIFVITDMFNKYRNIFSVLLLVLLVILTIYASYKRNPQAYFILFGWFIFFSSGMMMYLSSAGVFNIYKDFPYFVEIALVIEATVLSIALAYRIKQLQKEKESAHQNLLSHQKSEKKRLEIQVDQKTNNLKTALDEKELLLKELNHRVKNNMQTIVSLIRLQQDEINDEKLQSVLITMQNRIKSMSHLHELLYKQENISHINAYEYFELLVAEIKNSYNHDININFNIQTDLKIEQAIYCGLIVNELISNAFKYAFPTNKGNINITLAKKENLFTLSIKDDGIGYDKSKASNSLGLILVNTLAVQQLKGKIHVDADDGVNVTIHWNY
ncbi:MAG: hypothetical protein K0U47_03215 [Epsilonproteobacteria bacterium]|nr:hypothetical protein [Campylobacterota bacterium]